MQVGDILEMEPTMEGTSGLGTDGPQRCTVVWIHPDKRFFCGGVPQPHYRGDLAGDGILSAGSQ